VLENLTPAPKQTVTPLGAVAVEFDGTQGTATTPGMPEGADFTQFLIDAGAGNFVPGQTTLKPSTAKLATAPVKSLTGLKAKPAKAVKSTKVAAPVETVAPVIDEVVEITE
jgi:hypothetical protein